ncbi:MAG: DMT family transporter [Tepidisphaerales bacterium]
MTPEGRSHFAALMLLVATAAWCVSFSLAKDAGHRLNELSGAGDGAFFGPTALQGIRFLAGAVVWFALIPAARRGWTWAGVYRGTYTGLLLALGIILQHLALDRTTPAATAFLTSLSVLWVPLLLSLRRRSLPTAPLLVAVAMAAIGLYLMLGEGLTTFRTGEMLGLGCSLAFTFHLLAVSRVVRQEGPWRMCGAQFFVSGVVCFVLPLLVGESAVGPLGVLLLATDAEVAWRLGVILLFPTLLAFGLMNVYQPLVDPTRAVIIYMAEPVLASAFDWLLTGRGLSGIEWAGAALILVANAVAELRPQDPDAVPAPAAAPPPPPPPPPPPAPPAPSTP